jgi:hypothetical protein
MQPNRMMLMGAALLCGALSCNKDQPLAERVAPTASALAIASAAAPSAAPFVVDQGRSRFAFSMDSPLEKIDGEAPKSITGELFIDPTDLTRSTALVKADLNLLTLYQQKRGDEKGAYGERKKSELQNAHARDWLEISAKEPDVSPAQAEANRFAELRVARLENPSANDVTKLAGAERKVTAYVSGDLRLHGRKATKSAKIELTFAYAGDQLQSVHVETIEPFMVDLEEFEIHPRDTAGKLVKTLSDALASNLKGKVAKSAPVNVSFVAQPK